MQRALGSHGKHARGVPRLRLRLERRPVRIGPADRLAAARPPHGPALGAGGGLYVYPGIGVGLLAFPPTDSRRRDGPCRRAPRASGCGTLPRGSSNNGAAGRSCNLGPRSHRRKPKKGNAMNQKTIRLVLPILFAGAVARAQTPPAGGQNQNPPPPPQMKAKKRKCDEPENNQTCSPHTLRRRRRPGADSTRWWSEPEPSASAPDGLQSARPRLRRTAATPQRPSADGAPPASGPLVQQPGDGPEAQPQLRPAEKDG